MRRVGLIGAGGSSSAPTPSATTPLRGRRRGAGPGRPRGGHPRGGRGALRRPGRAALRGLPRPAGAGPGGHGGDRHPPRLARRAGDRRGRGGQGDRLREADGRHAGGGGRHPGRRRPATASPTPWCTTSSSPSRCWGPGPCWPGATGEVLLGRGEMLGNKPVATTTPELDWRASREMGGGAVIDSAYHEIYTVEALMGSPVRVVAAQPGDAQVPHRRRRHRPADLRARQRAPLHVTAAWHARTPGPPRAVGLDQRQRRGPAGRLLRSRPPRPRRWGAGLGGRRRRGPPRRGAGVRRRTAPGTGRSCGPAFEALERGRPPPPVSGAQARHNLALIVAAGEASAGRRAVEVPA